MGLSKSTNWQTLIKTQEEFSRLKFLLLLLLIPFPVSALDIPGPEGVTIELDDEAPYKFIRLRSIGESDLLLGDRKDVQRATKVATLKAKAAIARYIGEDVNTEEVVEQISESAQQSNGKVNHRFEAGCRKTHRNNS